jgi:hypothetical protein
LRESGAAQRVTTTPRNTSSPFYYPEDDPVAARGSIDSRSLSRSDLADVLGTSQARVSQLETQSDLYLSTLECYIEALGGEGRPGSA